MINTATQGISVRADGRHLEGVRPSHALGAAIVSALTIAITADVWKDIALTALHDEESGYILLVPLIAAWLVWVRRVGANDGGGS